MNALGKLQRNADYISYDKLFNNDVVAGRLSSIVFHGVYAPVAININPIQFFTSRSMKESLSTE